MILLLFLCSKLSRIISLSSMLSDSLFVMDKAGVTMQTPSNHPSIPCVRTSVTSAPGIHLQGLQLPGQPCLCGCVAACDAPQLLPCSHTHSDRIYGKSLLPCPSSLRVTAAAPSSCRAVPSAAAEPSPLRAYLQSLMIIFNSILGWMTTSMFQ